MRISEPGRGSQRHSYTRIPTGAYMPSASPRISRPAWDIAWGNARPSEPHDVDVIVIGAGQSGLAVSYELQRRGFVGYVNDNPHIHQNHAPQARTFLTLDAELRPGGAWQHRAPTLTMERVNHIADLPGIALHNDNPYAEAADIVPTYFAHFEDHYDLPILRPVLVNSVRRHTPHPHAPLILDTTAGTFRARVIVNCTGTWTRPFIPYYPGVAAFRGKQFHTQDYPGPRAFEDQRVIVVGGGISALSHLDDLGGIARKTTWVTRTPPRWRNDNHSEVAERVPGARTTPASQERSGHYSDSGLSPDEGRLIEARVRERVERGLRPEPVVAATGLPVTEWSRSLATRGLLRRRPMFHALLPDGAQWADGTTLRADAIIWATGFRFELRHLAPLRLRTHGGGIAMTGTQVTDEPRVHLVGYGPSASTIGARWAARHAVPDIMEYLNGPTNNEA
ncbi:NAD(P)-binding domain-containing protein [Arcanobacterium haemolyticum]|nr:NAD(P)-binding domain-containing protein [Arcanobacterium haemolyticum]